MANGGASPIGLYNFTTLTLSDESSLTFLPNINISVRPFLLSHGKMGDGSTYYSTAFLVRVRTKQRIGERSSQTNASFPGRRGLCPLLW